MFSSQQALDQHVSAKHYAFECRYCDRGFTTDKARQQHEDTTHATFECNYCDREFNSEDARDQHENAKHQFECQYCDRVFNSEEARDQHEDAKHRFECSHCDRVFNSEEAREQHKQAKHPRFNSKGPSWVEGIQQYGQITPQLQCSYCSLKFFTQDTKNGHEQSCGSNPANHVQHPAVVSPNRPPLQFGSLLPSGRGSTDTLEEGFSTPGVAQYSDKGSESVVSPPRFSDSMLDEGEMFHSTNGHSSVDATAKEDTVEQPRTCTCSLEAGTCLICQQTSSSNTDKPAPNDALILLSVDDHCQDDPMGHHDTIFQCTPCLILFETAGALRDHVCPSRTTMFRPQCPICYSQFDDSVSLQKHLEGVEFTCQLCLIQCCSEDMLLDHLLSHPTCSKCGKTFADNLALCAVSGFQSHNRLGDKGCTNIEFHLSACGIGPPSRGLLGLRWHRC